ncbi:DNA oxidative demethylase ALKBH2 [Eumeta japonica]|uniref:DNA oxidative demethylase ALKBH2 n=1 Tax=Eumeta variegata TaxID=151549 RepID=A0A4C1VZT6_EUMVA|nr:DNA oxidative demethylase ALKBH2 [Eumeta japonica]
MGRGTRLEIKSAPASGSETRSRLKISMDLLKDIAESSVTWRTIKEDGLNLEYSVPIPKSIADRIFQELENSLEYFTGNLTLIKVFGKVYPLPRQQVAYGEPGVTYTYSGVTVPALPWPEPVLNLRDFLLKLKGIKYNFVLVNRSHLFPNERTFY